MFVRATDAPVAEPLSRCTSAATPTVAQSCARRWYFRYDQPVESPSFGTRISVSSSPLADGGLEHPGEEVARQRPSLAAGTGDHELGAERQHHRREIGGRVAVGERAADRPAVADLRVADLARRRRDDRAVLLQQRIARARPRAA